MSGDDDHPLDSFPLHDHRLGGTPLICHQLLEHKKRVRAPGKCNLFNIIPPVSGTHWQASLYTL